MSQLDEYRAAKDAFFAQDSQSPLLSEQKQGFAGLLYFPEDPDLRLEVSLERPADTGPIEVRTSTGETQVYKRLGRFRFVVGEQEAELTLFEGASGLFLPFVDALAGKETYPAGRYLEPEPLPGDRYLIDFNLAYNPYCAYNERWSCPLTPFENRLKVPIRAGEKVFDTTH
jgi:uncharacterized protein (DUF1684 family)